MVLGKLDSHQQKNESGPSAIAIHKIKTIWIKDLKVRPETIKLIEENIGNILFDIGHKGNFSDALPTRTRETKEKISKWGTSSD